MRQRYGLVVGWHEQGLWNQLLDEARQRRADGLERATLELYGYDADADVLKRANENARRAGVERFIQFKQQPLMS